jgi:hypothetical protein
MLERYCVPDTDWTILNGIAPGSRPAVLNECLARKKGAVHTVSNHEPRIADAFVGDLGYLIQGRREICCGIILQFA